MRAKGTRGCSIFKDQNREVKVKWGCSSAGRAPALQAGGQGFDSPHLHQGETRGKETTEALKVWAYSSAG